MTVPPGSSESAVWLARATADLEKAAIMNELGGFDPGDVCAYAQQAAEKAIKAVLVCGPGAVPRMHDLRELRSRAEDEIAPHITDEMLTRLSVRWVSSRYPGDWPEPTQGDADEALEIARAIVTDAVRLLGGREGA